MYLKAGYFAERGPHPADDIGQGYLTATHPLDELPRAIIQASGGDAELLAEFQIDESVLEAFGKE